MPKAKRRAKRGAPRKPAVIRMWPFWGDTKIPTQQIIPLLILDPSPLSILQRYSPLSLFAIPLYPPIIGTRRADVQGTHKTRLDPNCLPETYLGEIIRPPSPGVCSSPDFMHKASYRDESGWDRAAKSLCLRSRVGPRKLPSGWHRVECVLPYEQGAT